MKEIDLEVEKAWEEYCIEEIEKELALKKARRKNNERFS